MYLIKIMILASRSKRSHFTSLVFMLMALLVCDSQASSASTTEMMATYGRGVHAYFSGQLSQSEQLFSQVIHAGSKDPRVYYFRAMVLLQQGRKLEAEEDMRMGAAFEAENPGNRLAVSRSLQRVQGYHRKTLENFRRNARLERQQMIRMQTQDRYEQLHRRNDKVLHKDAPVRLETLADPQTNERQPIKTKEMPQEQMPVEKSEEPSDPDDLFGDSASEDQGLFDDEPASSSDEGNSFPFDESEDVPAEESAPAEEEDEFDLFGKESSDDASDSVVGPSLTAEDSIRATTSTVASTPGEQAVGGAFFALGQWLSSDRAETTSPFGGDSTFGDSENVSQVGFDEFAGEESDIPSEESEDNSDDPFDF